MPKPTTEGQQVWDSLTPEVKQGMQDFHLRCASRPPLKPDDFTCANCEIVKTCAFSYDLYNLDGDCLAEK